MKSLIINRNKYLRTRPIFNGFLPIIIVAVIVLLSVVSFLKLSFYNDSAIGNSFATDVEQEEPISKIEEQVTENEKLEPDIIKHSTPENYYVDEVIDGDTIHVSGIENRIRLIGINTPETVDWSKPIQCFGSEASNYLSSLILGKYVGLEFDSATGDLDRYNRLLRYVYYNGENINQKLILEGYGKEASYGSEYKYRTQFIESENSAIANNKGLWSPVTCNGLE